MSNIVSFLQKSFQSLESSIILPLNKIGHSLVKCAKSNSYIETLGEHPDSLHMWIKESYEEDFKKSYEIQVRKALKHLPTKYARIAVDLSHEPFWGKTRSLFIINNEPNKKYGANFKYAVVSLITRNKQIPLMALPVTVGEGMAKSTIELLKYCFSLFKTIRLALFDRAYYVAEIIDYLEAKKVKYIILCPEKTGKIEDYVNQTDKLGKFIHQLRYSKKKSKWKPKTMIVVCKGINEFPWIFATNIKFRTRVEYIWYYKRRWQVETNFRVEDEGKIKSKSTHYLIRYFYFLIGLLLHLFWIVNKIIKNYTQYKKYLDIIETELLREYLKIGGI